MTEPVHFALSIPSVMQEGLTVQERLVTLIASRGFSDRDVFAMRLCLEEGLTNAIRHGNQLNPRKNVHLTCDIDNSGIRVVIQDEGEGFAPEAVPDPTQPEFLDRPGGRGLLLMRAYLDVCEYSDHGRRLLMERRRNSRLPVMDE